MSVLTDSADAATGAHAATGAQPHAALLQRIYTKHVIPDRLCAMWYHGFTEMSTVLPRGSDPEKERPRLVEEFSKFLVMELLRVESHPTLSRFFTFRGCVDRMLTMGIIGLPSNVFRVFSCTPREENQKRICRVLAFYRDPEAPQALRRASLVLQLTGVVEALTSSKPKEGEPPLAVALARGDGHRLVTDRMQYLFTHIQHDPVLEIGPAVTALLATAADLVLRLNTYLQWPFKIGFMCKKWFPATYLRAISSFVCSRSEQLDIGFSLQLQDLALAQGSEMQAISWLATGALQNFMSEVVDELVASSMEVERRHAHVKKWETSKVSNISTASRNLICARFAAWRDHAAHTLANAAEKLERARRCGASAIACQQHPTLMPQGVRWNSSNQCQPQAESPVQAQREQRRAQPQAPRTSAQPQAPRRSLSQYVQDNSGELKAQRLALVAEAEQQLDNLSYLRSSVPVTRVQLAAWLDDNLDEFQASMKTASARRRQGNVRVRARSGLPLPSSRFQPHADRAELRTTWATNLMGRTGWHGIRGGAEGHDIKRMVFLKYHLYQTYVINLEMQRVGPELCYNFAATGALDLCQQLQPLAQFEAESDGVTAVFEFHVEARPIAGGVSIRAARGVRIVAPLPRQRKTAIATDDGYESGECSNSDLSQSSGVVDTDVESASCSEVDIEDEADAHFATGAHFKTIPAGDGDCKAATGDDTTAASSSWSRGPARPPLWDNNYFYIADLGDDSTYVKIYLHKKWAHPHPSGLGIEQRSKTLTPKHYGESTASPVRSRLLLHAWMLWRAQGNAWHNAEAGRARQFKEDADSLEHAIRKLQPQVGGLLGNDRADQLLSYWQPELVAALLR